MTRKDAEITRCWVLTEGIPGTENQCLGVAESLGLEPVVKRIALRQPWAALSPYLGFEHTRTFTPALQPPWPDLLLAGGRKAIAAARYIKKQSGGKTFTVFLQDPRINPRAFDLVAAPAHDPVTGPNVIKTLAAPNRITPVRLETARTAFPDFENIRKPRVAVLIGGNSKAYTLTPDIMRSLAAQLKDLAAGLMITTSRRTGMENEKTLREILLPRHPVGGPAGASHERDPEKGAAKGGSHMDSSCLSSATQSRRNDGRDIFIWDGRGENPYFAMLAWADFILVTADSASMLSEACTTGKPVYMIPLKGGARRIETLHRNLVETGALRVFEGILEKREYPPLNDAAKIAEEIRKRYKGA